MLIILDFLVGNHNICIWFFCLSFNFFQAHAESSKTWLTGKFTELRLLLDEEEALAKKFIDKNTQLALQVYREQIESCGEQINVMNSLSDKVWSISQERNPIQLLQVRRGFCPHSGHWPPHFILVRVALNTVFTH